MQRELKFLIVCFAFVVLVSTIQFFANDILLQVTKFERDFYPERTNPSFSEGADCKPIEYVEEDCGGRIGIETLARNGYKNIVVPLVLLEDAAIVAVAPNLHKESVRLASLSSQAKPLTLKTFFETYEQNFDHLIFAVRWIAGSQRAGVRQMLGMNWNSRRHSVIADSCDFIFLFGQETGIPTSCTAQGIVSNYLLGHAFWTAEHGAINRLQLKISRKLEYPALVRGLSPERPANHFCRVHAKKVIRRLSELVGDAECRRPKI